MSFERALNRVSYLRIILFLGQKGKEKFELEDFFCLIVSVKNFEKLKKSLDSTYICKIFLGLFKLPVNTIVRNIAYFYVFC